MVVKSAVLSLFCALLKRLVCPVHPTRPWRYQHFVIWLSSHLFFSTLRFCLLSLHHLYQSTVLFLRPSRFLAPAQISFRSSISTVSRATSTHAHKSLNRSLCEWAQQWTHNSIPNRALELKSQPPPAWLPEVYSTDRTLSTPKPLPFQLKVLPCITSDSKEKDALSLLFSKCTLVLSGSFVHAHSQGSAGQSLRSGAAAGSLCGLHCHSTALA